MVITNSSKSSACSVTYTTTTTSSPIVTSASYSSPKLNVCSCAPYVSKNADLLNEVNVKINSMMIEFQKQIADLNLIISQILENCNSMQTQLSSFDSYNVDNRLDALERKFIADEVIIDGVPNINSHNLTLILDSLCEKIKINRPEVQNIYRLKRNSRVSDGSILVKFANISGKVNFMRSVRKFIKTCKRPLNLNDINLNSNKNIYIHERLTKRNYILFRKALNLKKSPGGLDAISNIFTKNGLVFVVPKENDDPVVIENVNALAAIENEIKQKNEATPAV